MLIPITKIDEEKRLVTGRAAQEVVDRSGEVMDYATAKPQFEVWSDSQREASSGKSLGNVRAMHGATAAGVLTDIGFNDAEKAIDVTAHVVDDGEWAKVLAGVYTGFSMGGKYLKRWQDGDVTRYTPQVAELSLVDRPCVPTALFADVIKADGSVDKLELKGQTMDETTEQRGAEASTEATNADAAQKDAATTKAEPLADLKKWLGEEVWDASRAIDALNTLTSLLSGELSEQENQPDQIAALRSAIERVKAFIVSEIQENHDAPAQANVDLLAQSDAATDLQKRGAKISAANKAHIDEIRKCASSVLERCDKLDDMGADKAEDAGDLTKAVETARADTLAKVQSDTLAPIAKALGLADGADLLDAVTKAVAERDVLRKAKADWEAKPAAPKGVVVAVTKQEDAATGGDASEVEALEKRLKNLSPEQAAQAVIKFQMQHGGRHLIG